MIDRMSGRVSLLLVSVALIVVLLLGWFVLVAPQRSKASKLDWRGRPDERAVAGSDESSARPDRPAESRCASGLARPPCRTSRRCRRFSVSSLLPRVAGVELDCDLTRRPAVAICRRRSGADDDNVKGHYFAIQRFLRTLRSEAVLRGDKFVANGRLYTVDSIQFAGRRATRSPDRTERCRAAWFRRRLTVNAFVYAPTAVPGAADDADHSDHDLAPPDVVASASHPASARTAYAAAAAAKQRRRRSSPPASVSS